MESGINLQEIGINIKENSAFQLTRLEQELLRAVNQGTMTWERMQGDIAAARHTYYQEDQRELARWQHMSKIESA